MPKTYDKSVNLPYILCFSGHYVGDLPHSFNYTGEMWVIPIIQLYIAIAVIYSRLIGIKNYVTLHASAKLL